MGERRGEEGSLGGEQSFPAVGISPQPHFGPHTSAQVHLPLEDSELDARQYDDERGEVGGYGGAQVR